MEKAILKSIEGGWDDNNVQWVDSELSYIINNDFDEKKWFYNGNYAAYANISEITSDPLFWECLGRSLRWRDVMTHEYSANMVMPGDAYENMLPIHAVSRERLTRGWKNHWHRFIDHLAEGKDVDSYFNQLLK